MSRTPDAIVVGGGLIGCLAARALADDGRRVTVFERGAELGRKASTAAAGMLSPQMEWAEDLLVEGADDLARRTDAMLDLGIAARGRWPAFAAALEAETGRRLHYRDEGTLVVALTDVEADELEARARTQRRRGLRAEWLEPGRVQELEPGIAGGAVGALYIPDDRQVDPLPLMAAAGEALVARAGVRIETGTTVRAVVSAGGRGRSVERGGRGPPATAGGPTGQGADGGAQARGDADPPRRGRARRVLRPAGRRPHRRRGHGRGRGLRRARGPGGRRGAHPGCRGRRSRPRRGARRVALVGSSPRNRGRSPDSR